MSSEADIWVGIDLGTQSVRCVAVDDDGRIHGSGSSALTSHRESGRHEQDPDQWWDAVVDATRTAMATVPPDRVRAVAVDATSGTILLTDASGVPVTEGIMYDDARGADAVDAVNEAGGALWESLGYQRMQPTWALPTLVHLLRGRDTAGLRVQHQSDFINRRLIGELAASDLSSALKTGADLAGEQWPSDVMDALGIDDSLLPPLVRSGRPLGVVSAGAAEQTGLPAGTVVISGATDGCAAQLGAGAITPGSWNSVLGTTLILKGVSSSPVRDPLGVVYSHRGPDGGWLPGGASSSGAGVISARFGGADLGQLENALARRGLNPDVVTYPLATPGERFPFAAPGAHSFTLGSPVDDVDEFGALLLGLAFVERLSFEYLRSLGASTDGPWILTGGGTRNRLWNQLRADVNGRDATLTANAEPALGMAVLAAASQRSLATAADSMVVVRERIHAAPEAGARYQASYETFVRHLERLGWLPAHVARIALTGMART
ncbi:carbohydrate kinase [Microbacterium sp. HMWF026]|uniref:FGGY-family carbohydrate kinase n=1 Tax=Microbacterium sp. HMWF026 TaxID=2056861 RepID=UPI000D391056|nr:FGGY family carbohydrate kinase [Microbacterium sp. HMWF026]PTT19415.1 carbohydrate kinase [Microbacterium sp. HMWF026]